VSDPPLSAAVLPAALQNVVLHLEKLGLEGRIKRVNKEEGEGQRSQEGVEEEQVNSTSGSSSDDDWGPERDYGELSESTSAMIQRKADWTWTSTG
jgi:hypothetical protein